MEKLTVALPTGRLKGEVLKILSLLSGWPENLDFESRQLVLESADFPLRFILTHPKDVSTYVEYGAADVGLVGKDILLERQNEVYELLDLGIGKCAMVLAAPEGTDAEVIFERERLRVATKYPNFTRSYLQERGIHADIVFLYGSIELAPAIGLAECIIDLVSTGKTLRENKLHVVEEIAPVSVRLVANRVSIKTKSSQIAKLAGELKEVVRLEKHSRDS
ncbi:MAG: phosphoribosyltransferase [Candidatus Atribacteria bacterium]|uniref:ATP phosphoribosyltransferase n=1 Tax=Thermatribacter velox TaxID=3039681 RepID=A0ABZ2YCR8_9BACT|nr:phosphoribosyltransferase [Candidatus Atribacteria bacterium]